MNPEKENSKKKAENWSGKKNAGKVSGRKSTKKIVIYVLTGIFSAIAVAAAVLGIKTYFEYEAIHMQTSKLLEAQEQYDSPNFDDSEFNYLEIPLKKEVRPGQAVTFNVYYKNTGLIEVENLTMEVMIPPHLTPAGASISVYEKFKPEISGDSVVLNIGSLAPGDGDVLSLDFTVESPLENKTLIYSPAVRLKFIKQSPLIGRKNFFTMDYNTAGTLIVVSSPDFSGSDLKILESDGVIVDGVNTLTYGDSITYQIDLSNSGDMNAQNIEVKINALENLVPDPDENPDFTITGGLAELEIESLDAGQSRSFYFKANVDEGAENNSVISPVLDISYSGSVSSFKSPESIVKLYPSFTSSSVSIAARGSGGLYSGDVVDVKVNVKNTGNIEAENVVVKLVISNLFVLDQGQTAWEIAKLVIGETATFQTSLRIVEGIVKDTYAGVLLKVSSDSVSEIEAGQSSVLVSGERPFTRGVIPVVALHGIEPDPHGNYEISTAAFDYLCGTLKALGYKTVTFMDLLAYLDSGKRLPEKPVILTSDDGYYSIFVHAFPILQKYGYKMTVFLSTGYIGNSNEDRHLNEFDIGKSGIPERPMLIWPEVAAMARYGIEFQSHTVTHSQIGDLSPDEVYFELAQSKADIEAHLKRPCSFVSWPFDNFSNSVIPLLPQIGYRGAVRYRGGVEDVRSMNIYAIKRVQVFSYTSTASYAAIMGLF